MKKIGIIGTASAGKTTMCYDILSKLKHAGIKADGVLQQDCRLNFDRSFLDTNPLAQWALILQQMQVEAEMSLRKGIDVLVCDRTPFDLYAYFAETQKGNTKLKAVVDEWCRLTFDRIYLLRPVAYEVSEVRCSEDFRDRMTDVIRDHATKYIQGSFYEEHNLFIEPLGSEASTEWREQLPNDILALVRSK